MTGKTFGEMQSLNSSHLLGCSYDQQAQTLRIDFRSGHTWQYDDVPQSVYDGLISAGSKGSYFHRNIKGRFSERQV